MYQTKQEEERRQNSDVQPNSYQPDFTVHNESASGSSTTGSGAQGIMAAALGQPQKHKQV